MTLLVSACLLGVCCRYDGESKPCEAVLALRQKHTLIPVCPEQLGGLPTPRVPAERVGDRVITRDGRDVTEAYLGGSEQVVRIARLLGADGAVLKQRSPACGVGLIYDGSFSGRLKQGDGVLTERLRAEGLAVLSLDEEGPACGL